MDIKKRSLMLGKPALVSPHQVLEDLKNLCARYPQSNPYFEADLWEILEYDNPSAIGWVASPVESAEALLLLGLDFERMCDMFEADFDTYTHAVIADSPENYLADIDHKKLLEFAILGASKKTGIRNPLTEDEIWDTVIKIRFENQYKKQQKNNFKEGVKRVIGKIEKSFVLW